MREEGGELSEKASVRGGSGKASVSEGGGGGRVRRQA